MRFAVRFTCFALFFIAISLPVSAAVLTVTNTNDSGAGSLRQALSTAASGDRIEFAIGSGPQTIKPQTSLPVVTAAIVIDGRTQPGYNGKPIIEIDGSYPYPSQINGFDLRNTAEIYGLVINSFSSSVYLERGGLYNCYIGTDVTGMIAKAYWSDAVRVAGDPSTPSVIGGAGANGNLFVVAGGYSALQVGPNVSIQGNVFGTNATQTAVLGGGGMSIRIEGNNVRVGDEVANVIINSQFGVLATFAANIRVEDNIIGTTASGVSGGMERGVHLYSTTDSLVQNNVIKGASHGVVITGDDTKLRNKVLGNSISNADLGIDLEQARPFPYGDPTPNDADDADVGVNNYINYPVIASSTTNSGQTTITGSLDTLPNTTQRVELFASSACTTKGYGPGETLIDAFDVTTDATGAATFTRTLSALPFGKVITATATSDAEGTSELSPCITNEGPGTFSFKGPSYGVDEGATRAVTINRVDGTSGEVMVTYAVTGGTASATDFSGASGSVTFADGETFKSFDVQATSDSIYEAGETIVISLNGVTGGASIGSPSTTTVTIADDDLPPAVIVQSTSIDEGDSGTTIAQVPISLGQAAEVAYSVAYMIVSGNATADSDFAAESGSITFAPGETQKHIPVTILGDLLYEWTENVAVTFPTLSIEPAFVGILNDDAPPTVFIRDVRVVESSGTFSVTLESEVPVLGHVSIAFADGSAHAGSDFTPTPTTFTFDWETSKTVPITIIGDDVPEGDEQFEIEITSLSEGITAGPNAVVTIVNDDLRVTPAEQWIPSGGTGAFTVELGTSSEDVTLALTPYTSDISMPSTLVIPAGASSADFTVSALAPGVDVGITVGMPLDRGNATRVVLARTYAKTTLRFTPARLTIVEGEIAEVSVSLDPPSSMPTTIGLNPTGRVDVPSSLTIPAGGSATFLVSATMAGAFAIDAQLPPIHGNEVQSLFGDVIVPESAIQIATVTPSSGTTAGGTHVRVNGSHFDGSCWLFFGRVAASDVIVRSAESITGVTPAHAIDTTDVTVRCTGGAFTSENAFSYRDDDDPAPLITAIEPAAAAPGEFVTITGLNFRPTDNVAFDAASVEIVDAAPESHVVVVPDLLPGDARISINGMSGPLFSVLEARPTHVTAVTPSRVAPGGELELTGEGFRASTVFEIGGHPATILSVEPARAIVRVSFDAVPGTHSVLGGPSVEIVDDGMIVTSANPRCATTSGGVYTLLHGRGFAAGTTVSFAGALSPHVEVLNAMTLRARVPEGNAGSARIVVTNGTQSATLTNGFTYVSPFDPRGCSSRTRSVRR